MYVAVVGLEGHHGECSKEDRGEDVGSLRAAGPKAHVMRTRACAHTEPPRAADLCYEKLERGDQRQAERDALRCGGAVVLTALDESCDKRREERKQQKEQEIERQDETTHENPHHTRLCDLALAVLEPTASHPLRAHEIVHHP
eukprot:6702593-Prymnesium_polylepis.1